MPQPLMPKKLKVELFYDDVQDLLELIPKNDVLFITVDWNAKVGSQEIPGITGKFGFGVQNETGFTGGPVVRTTCNHCSGHRFDPWLEN